MKWLAGLLSRESGDPVAEGLTRPQQVIIEQTAGHSAAYIAHVMSNGDGKGVPLLRTTLDDRMSSELFNDLVKSASALPPAYQEIAIGITTHMHQLRGMSQGDARVIGYLLSLPPEAIADNTRQSVSMITHAVVNSQIQGIETGRGR